MLTCIKCQEPLRVATNPEHIKLFGLEHTLYNGQQRISAECKNGHWFSVNKERNNELIQEGN